MRHLLPGELTELLMVREAVEVLAVQLCVTRMPQAQLKEFLAEWLEIQRHRSIIPAEDEMLVETFQRGSRHYLVCYPFDGRISHGTLCQLLARRLERAGKEVIRISKRLPLSVSSRLRTTPR